MFSNGLLTHGNSCLPKHNLCVCVRARARTCVCVRVWVFVRGCTCTCKYTNAYSCHPACTRTQMTHSPTPTCLHPKSAHASMPALPRSRRRARTQAPVLHVHQALCTLAADAPHQILSILPPVSHAVTHARREKSKERAIGRETARGGRGG